MREIVFRGKSSREWKNVKSGQWVNGCGNIHDNPELLEGTDGT